MPSAICRRPVRVPREHACTHTPICTSIQTFLLFTLMASRRLRSVSSSAAGKGHGVMRRRSMAIWFISVPFTLLANSFLLQGCFYRYLATISYRVTMFWFVREDKTPGLDRDNLTTRERKDPQSCKDSDRNASLVFHVPIRLIRFSTSQGRFFAHIGTKATPTVLDVDALENLGRKRKEKKTPGHFAKL